MHVSQDDARDGISELKSIDMELLKQAAIEASKRAYCPYSNYRVGAALLCTDGTIFPGCNVENASYGLCICAERAAILNAISSGKNEEFPAMAVYAPDGSGIALPCGACRQFLIEFNPKMWVLSVNADGFSYQSTWRAADLLPEFFGRSTISLTM